MTTRAYPLPSITSHEDWLAARKALLARERSFTRQRDELNAERRALPMVEIDKRYEFDGMAGRATLADLFEGRRQLMIYHFMLDPAHEEGCVGCSNLADNIPHLSHLHARETTFVMVSRAPLARIAAFKSRMGWTMPWYSSYGSDFNYDFHVSMDAEKGSTEWNYEEITTLKPVGDEPPARFELPGLSVFLRDGARVFHTYSTYARGLDLLINTYNLLDLTPFGRGEGWDGMPDVNGQGMNWLRHHDRYGNAADRSCHAEK